MIKPMYPQTEDRRAQERPFLRRPENILIITALGLGFAWGAIIGRMWGML